MKTRIQTLLFIALAVLAFVIAGCTKSDSASQQAGTKAAKYFCPMHPSYVSDRPGDCPICNMKLVPVGSDAGTMTNLASLPGRVAIQLSPEKRQMIGLATSVVQTQRLAHTIRVPATLSHDETTLVRIAPRFSGWVKKLLVNYTGQRVEAGEPLFTVYSPDLFSAGNDYLVALRQARAQTNNPETKNLLEGSRRRLELMQVSAEEIRALEEKGSASDEMTFRAPIGGHVIAKTAVEGKSLMSGESLYEIAPLHRLWVLAAVPEIELNRIKVGQKARVSFSQRDQKPIAGTISFINPHVDPQTRRGEARMVIENPEHALRPDMWASVEIDEETGDTLCVPASAVLDTGTRNIAFVDRGEGYLEPREVKIGAKSDDQWQVLDGLKASEKVVTRALFLVDSESQLRAVVSAMSAPEHKH